MNVMFVVHQLSIVNYGITTILLITDFNVQVIGRNVLNIVMAKKLLGCLNSNIVLQEQDV